MFFVSVANRNCFDFLGQIAINFVRNPSGICACLLELTTAEVMDFLPVRGTCQHLSSPKASMLDFCLCQQPSLCRSQCSVCLYFSMCRKVRSKSTCAQSIWCKSVHFPQRASAAVLPSRIGLRLHTLQP